MRSKILPWLINRYTVAECQYPVSSYLITRTYTRTHTEKYVTVGSAKSPLDHSRFNACANNQSNRLWINSSYAESSKCLYLLALRNITYFTVNETLGRIFICLAIRWKAILTIELSTVREWHCHAPILYAVTHIHSHAHISKNVAINIAAFLAACLFALITQLIFLHLPHIGCV